MGNIPMSSSLDNLMDPNFALDLSGVPDPSTIDMSTLANIPMPPLVQKTPEQLAAELYQSSLAISQSVLGRPPTQDEINQTYGADSPYYKQTFLDRLKADGQFNLYAFINPQTKSDTIIRFQNGTTWYYTDISYRDEFEQAGYKIALQNGSYFALLPGQSVSDAIGNTPPPTSTGPVYDNVIDAGRNAPPPDPIDTALADNIVWNNNPAPPHVWNPSKPPVEVAPPLQATSEIDLSQYAPLLLVGAAILGMASKK